MSFYSKTSGEMMLPFGKKMLSTADTNEKIQVERLGSDR